MKKSTWIVVAIIIIIAAAILLVSKNSGEREAQIIKIGFIGPLSGDGTSYGVTEKNATKLAVDKINAKGGIKGRTIEVIYEDSKGSGKDAVSAVQKLINIDGVKIILGGAFSSETLAAAPITDQNKVILFSAFSSNPKLSGISKYFFRSSPSDSDVARTDANAVLSQGYKKVAIISENTDYSLGVRDIMKQVFATNNITVVYDEVYNTSQSDFKSILTKIKVSGADVLYVNPNTSAQIGGIIVKQARQLGIVIPIHGNYALASADAITAGGSYMNGILVSDSPTLSESGNQILNEYKTNFNTDPVSQFEMASRYDSVNIIAQAIGAVGTNTDDLARYISNMPNYDGALGSYHFNKDGDVVGVSFKVFIIKDGKETPFTQ
ncbi:MAG: ABC transporter substrate-binding protein [Candidatus Taylorbacteria bacterium]|nr:ABC transporter substrate-binding protein [Candidatus Taylorbacteria bacterium]